MTDALETIKRLNQQAWELSKKDIPAALALALQIHELWVTCDQAGPVDEFECLRTQSYCLDMLSQPREALPIALQANRLAEQIGDTFLTGSIQSLLGRIHWHIDDYASAMDYYQSALHLPQIENYLDLEVALINGLGLVQYGLENYTEALGYFKTCLEKAGKAYLTGRADANNNIGYTLHMLGRNPEALEYDLEALALFTQMGTSVGKMETLHSLGAIYHALGQNEPAMGCLQQGLELARQNNSRLFEISSLIEIGRIQQDDHQLDAAEAEILQALEMAQKINSLTNICLAHECLTQICKEKGDFQAALSHFEAFHAAFKQIYTDKSDQRIKNLEVLHRVEITRKQADLYRQMAATDFLTNLVNVRSFQEIAETALVKANQDQTPLAMIMLDIDRYKAINDQFGHLGGDEILAEVAARIKKSLRQGDVAGRYGGDEFIILVSGVTPDICLKIAERIRQAISQEPVLSEKGGVSVTASLGLACLDLAHPVALAALIGHADQAMYQAKAQGRNQVQVWSGAFCV